MAPHPTALPTFAVVALCLGTAAAVPYMSGSGSGSGSADPPSVCEAISEALTEGERLCQDHTCDRGMCTCAALFDLNNYYTGLSGSTVRPGTSCAQACGSFGMTCAGRHSDSSRADSEGCGFFERDEASRPCDVARRFDDDDVCVCAAPAPSTAMACAPVAGWLQEGETVCGGECIGDVCTCAVKFETITTSCSDKCAELGGTCVGRHQDGPNPASRHCEYYAQDIPGVACDAFAGPDDVCVCEFGPPTTASPTPSPTTSAPTPSPTTSTPTASPTPSPTTSSPTPSPTTSSPTMSTTTAVPPASCADFEALGGFTCESTCVGDSCTCAAMFNVLPFASCTAVCEEVGLVCTARHNDGPRGGRECEYYFNNRFPESCNRVGGDAVCVCSTA